MGGTVDDGFIRIVQKRKSLRERPQGQFFARFFYRPFHPWFWSRPSLNHGDSRTKGGFVVFRLHGWKKSQADSGGLGKVAGHGCSDPGTGIAPSPNPGGGFWPKVQPYGQAIEEHLRALSCFLLGLGA